MSAELPELSSQLLLALAERGGMNAAEVSALLRWKTDRVRGAASHLVILGLAIIGGPSNRRRAYALTDAGRQAARRLMAPQAPARPVRVYLAARASDAPARVSLPAEPWGVI